MANLTISTAPVSKLSVPAICGWEAEHLDGEKFDDEGNAIIFAPCERQATHIERDTTDGETLPTCDACCKLRHPQFLSHFACELDGSLVVA